MLKFKLNILIGLLIGGSAFAATTGNITIEGTVAANTAIVVTTVTGFNTLDLHTTQSDLNVAVVTEQNNTALGYDVELTSSNSGQLQNGSSNITYTATYDGASVTLSSTAQDVTNQGAQTSSIDVDKDFDISYTGVPVDNLLQGTYSDTLTFEIIAN